MNLTLQIFIILIMNHTESKATTRDNRIDLLRFIGLAMIILAHVSPPDIVFQGRNFDVPLMVIVAGLSFQVSYRYESYISYLWKRIKRLLFPVWLFLSIVFSYSCDWISDPGTQDTDNCFELSFA